MTNIEADYDEEWDAAPLLPRQQQGSPQHLLLTLLGDYWYGHQEALPSRALSAVLSEFGISYQGARAAISRLSRRGLLEFSRYDGRSGYRLTKYANSVLTEGLQRILQFGTSPNAWDGSWTVVIFSVPESQRELRHVARTRLRWLGFSPLYNGTWVSPWQRCSEAARLLSEVGVRHAIVLRSTLSESSPESPTSAWDLDALTNAYNDFLDEFSPLLERAQSGNIGTAEALLKRILLMDAWRQFPAIDPDLPAELLPPDFPRSSARNLFAELYDMLGPLAEIRIRRIFSNYAPDQTELIRSHVATHGASEGDDATRSG
jgi:phenylacetic acid degradation operon negative regulatory protein